MSWPRTTLANPREAPRLRRGALNVWGLGGHVVAPHDASQSQRSATAAPGRFERLGAWGPCRGPHVNCSARAPARAPVCSPRRVQADLVAAARRSAAAGGSAARCVAAVARARAGAPFPADRAPPPPAPAPQAPLARRAPEPERVRRATGRSPTV